ncbi:hypothetical protein ACK30Y_13970 [Aeromonas caviae]
MIDKNKIASIAKKSIQFAGAILSAIGIINILDDLNSWRLFGLYLIEKSSFIGLEDVFHYTFLFIHTISTYWHLWLHPIFDLLTSWLPFKIPFLIKDMLIIALFVIMGKRKAFRVFTQSLKKEKQVMSKIVHQYLKNQNERFLYFSIRDAKSYILMHNADKGILESYEIQNIEKFNRCFGEDAEAFAYDVLTNPELLQLHEQHLSALNLSENLKKSIYFLASIVIVFLLFDYIYLLQQNLN